MKQFFNRSNRKGFSMVELLLVFAIIMGAAVMVFVVYPKVKANSVTTEENQNITTIQGGVKSLFQSKANYSQVSPSLLIAASVVPNTMVSGTTLVNRWGGAVTIGPSTAVPNGYAITYASVPDDICFKLVPSVGMNFVAVGVGSAGSLKTKLNEEIDMTKLASACVGGTSGNTLYFDDR